VSELLLDVVRPAGIEAAQSAAEQLACVHQRQRELMVDRVQACREVEARAAREYKFTDETYTTVRRKLAAEWDDALQALHTEQGKLDEFDAQRPTVPTVAEREQLERLGDDLSRVWFDEKADTVLKKQITRTLIEEILVDVDEEQDEIVLWIHWSGGHHTEHHEPRRGRRRRLRFTDLQAVMETLRKVLPDESIAAVLNREGIPTSQGGNWSKNRVATFRRQQKIAAYNAREQTERGWLTQAQAATRLEISPMSVSRLVDAGILPAIRTRKGLPSVIQEQDLQLTAVQSAIRHLKEANNGPLPADSNQLSLFPIMVS